MALLPSLKPIAAKPATAPLKPTAIAPKPATAATSPVYQNKETDVAKIAAGITGTDSLLMRQARTEGLKTANRRGLLSSSMAAGAAQGAVVAKAGELAQATAGYNAAENVATADRLSTEKRAAAQLASTEKLNANTLTAQQKLQTQALASESKEKKLDRGLQTELAKWNLDSSDKQNAASMLSTSETLFQQSLASINSNKDLSAAQRTAQIKALTAKNASFVTAIKSLYDVDISFGTKPKPAATTAKPGATAKPTTSKPATGSAAASGLPKSPHVGMTATNKQTGKKMVYTKSGWAIAS
jgi:hypothetical protein